MRLVQRLRYYNFHQSLEDKCHRMLNAVEPGTVVPIHRHPAMYGLVSFALFSDNNYAYFFRKLSTFSGKDTLEINCSTVACSATNCVFAEYQRVGVHRSGSWA